MKVMICQPMNNKTNQQIRQERKEIVEKLEKLHIEVYDTIIEETADPKKYNEYTPALFYLSKSIDFIAQADAVYFMDGWETARGCRIEHLVCEEYGIKILDSSFFKDEPHLKWHHNFCSPPFGTRVKTTNESEIKAPNISLYNNHIPRID